MNIALKRTIQMLALALTVIIIYYGIAWVLNQVPTDGAGTDEQQRIDKGKDPRFTFDDLLDAIEWVESKGDIIATGKDGEVGAYQIKTVYVDDVNRIALHQDLTKAHDVDQHGNEIHSYPFSYNARTDRNISRAMVRIYLTHYIRSVQRVVTSPPNERFTGWDHRKLEFMARIHNGGPEGYRKESTKAYWAKVKARMENSHDKLRR